MKAPALPLLLAAAVVASAGAPGYAQTCRIAGKWKSSEQKTLANMRKVRLTDKQRQALDGLFGKAVVTWTCTEGSAVYEGQTTRMQIRSLKEPGDRAEMVVYNVNLKEEFRTTLTFQGDCYAVRLDIYGFDEVFCRVR